MGFLSLDLSLIKRMTDPSKLLKEQILELEAEIEDLQTKIDAKEHLAVSCQSLSQIKNANDGAASNCESNVTDSFIAKLNEELQILSTLTGIDLIDVIGVPLDDAEENSFNRMHYSVKGTSYGITFELHFNVLQSQTEVHIDHLEIDSIGLVNNDLGSLFDNLESEHWLQGFIQVFVPYTKLRCERRKIFQNIQEKFGDLVQFPGNIFGSEIEFSHYHRKEDKFRIKWDFSLSPPDMSHVVKLHVNALPSAAKSKSAAQRNRTLKQAPEMFDKMVERFGPEAAVESFIRSSVIDDTETT